MVKEGSRKFWAFIIATVVCVIALFTKFMTGDNFTDIMQWVIGGFGAGNAAEHVSKKWQ